jgi:calcium-dependent protein kinase
MSKKSVGQKYEYELSGRLGQGAFAEVYKGRNRLTDEVVAIKVIKRSLLAKYGYRMLI